ncbi:pirin domain-containing protein [Gloeopeniophorella convolvens]|nr:pirin domain-containing protein [Gloeopeniophorella convolvens]
MSASIQFDVRSSTERGNSDHGWLKTFHTFNFADYYDPKHAQFGSLRVLHEDRVEAHTGFGTHGHREFEIFSCICTSLVPDEPHSNDSMGNTEVLKRGDLQMTSAGTGILHSEHAHGDKQVHFLQIWAKPSTSGLKPSYFTRHFTDEEKRDAWAHVVAPVGEKGVSDAREAAGPAPVHAPLSLYATLLSPGKSLIRELSSSASRKAYVHVVQTSGYNPKQASGNAVRVGAAGAQDAALREGDGLYVTAPGGAAVTIENTGSSVAEVLFFEIA